MRRKNVALVLFVVACDSANSSPPAAPLPVEGAVAAAAVTASAIAVNSAPSAVLSAPATAPATAPMAGNEPVLTAQSANEFTLKLFATSRVGAGNCMQSAFSVRAALAMVALGAKGATYTQLATSLGLALTPAQIAAQALRERAELDSARGAGAQLLAANKLYAEKTYPLRPDFLGLAERGFDAKSDNLDFSNAAEPARALINKWVSDKTAGKILDLIPAGGVDSLTRLVLTNAVYFKAGWMTAFPAANTKPVAFFESATSSVPVPTMHLSSSMRYAAVPGFKVLELPYTGTNVVMNIVLPDDRAGLPKVEAELTVASLSRAFDALASRQVDLALPKFGFSWGADLVPALKSLGIQLPFERMGADFTGMSDAKGDDRLYLTKVFHKSFIKVDEQGTEAAAATAAVMGIKGMAMPQTPVAFRADHPFLFFIRDFGSGRIYFMGRVNSPKTN